MEALGGVAVVHPVVHSAEHERQAPFVSVRQKRKKQNKKKHANAYVSTTCWVFFSVLPRKGLDAPGTEKYLSVKELDSEINQSVFY